MSDQPHHEHDGSHRRAFCKACIGCLGAGSVAAVGYPVVTFMAFPHRTVIEKPFEVPLDKLAVGQAQYGRFHGAPIAVLMNQSGPLVLSAVCTHLGCTVIWEPSDAVFRCPCHGATFDSTGKVLSGPTNIPLPTVPFKIEDGTIVVS